MAKSILKRLKKGHTPLIDGNIATFVWQGKSAPGLVGDFTGWEGGEPVKLSEKRPGLWIYQLDLPGDAYIEYSFVKGEENLPDPLNPRVSPNGIGGYNHYFQMPGYQPTTLAEKNRNVPHGKVTRHTAPTEHLVFGTQRTVYLYQPPVQTPAPLMVIWDGQEYLNRMHLNIIVDNLIAEHRIQPLALAFVKNGGSTKREFEYACNDLTLLFLINEVLPLARNELNLIDVNMSPGVYGVVGASMGGLMALYTGVRFPRIFGHVLSQSGAFSLGGLNSVVFDLIEHGERRPLKIWLDAGVYDIPGLLSANRQMKQELDHKGYSSEYREYNAGHNYPAWRDEIWRGLISLYGIRG